MTSAASRVQASATPILAVDAGKLSSILSRSVQQGTYEKFAIQVKNNTLVAQKVALLPAYFNTVDIGATSVTKGDVTELNRNGFGVTAVAFDGSRSVGSGTTPPTVDFSSGNPGASIDAFLRYIRTNPRQLKSMLIVSSDQNAFSSSIELTKANPMGNGKMVPIDINQFFSPNQYQSDRVIIDFADYPLEICDDLVMTAIIPAGASVEYNFRF